MTETRAEYVARWDAAIAYSKALDEAAKAAR